MAAHATAGGGWPSGGAAALLLAVVAATGLAAGRAAQPRTLTAVLAAGQIAGHTALAISGHTHETPLFSWQSMVLAHAVAVVAGAGLMAVSERLIRALGRVVRRCVAVVSSPADAPPPLGVRPEHQQLQQILLFSSISYRGPPVCAAP